MPVKWATARSTYLHEVWGRRMDFPLELNGPRLERGFLIQALRDNNWNRRAAAQELGIGRQTLWRRIKRLNIQPPKADGRSSRSSNDRQGTPH